MHNTTWSSIYRSQLLLLTEMNHKAGIVPMQAARSFYDEAVKGFPQIYTNYAFEQWLGFLKGDQLIIEHPSSMLELTHKAKDFLKYVAHWGADINGKKA